MTVARVSCSLAVLALAQGPAPAQDAPFTVWVADAMDKVLPGTTPPDTAPDGVELSAARGEIENAQVVVRSDADLSGVSVAVTDLSGPAGTIPASAVEIGHLGFVPIQANTADTPPEELIATAPCEVPDPVLPGAAFDIAAGRAQPVWLTLRVPREAAAGTYEGEVRVSAVGAEVIVPLRLTVFGFEMPQDRHLLYTNWCSPDEIAKKHGLELWSKEYWAMLGRYLDMMAEHRQNILWVSPGSVSITEEADGTYSFDYSLFDRWVETCEAHGVCDRIEIQQLGSFGPDGWNGSEIVLSPMPVRVRATGESRSVAAEEILPHYLPALETHLEAKGWLEKTLLHIADEPSQNNTASWSEKSAFVHQYAPRIRHIDAIEGPSFEGLDVWVPKLTHLRSWLPQYERARANGAELWFYTCCHPMGLYPNRFLDFSLLKTRILHWYNWRYDLSGYLHWGLNFWTDDPYTQVTSSGLPPGDCFIVYPGTDGPVSSIRWDALRDGIEDYEYLWILRDRTSAVLERLGSDVVSPSERADEIARSIVRDFVDYARTNDEMRAARAAVAAEIEAMESDPPLVVATDPPTNEDLIPGPIVVFVRGVTVPGAAVTVNGNAVAVTEGGEFRLHVFVSEDSPVVTVQASKDGASKTVVRRWTVREHR